ncbi:glycosyltransferase, TIGR04182 family [Archaeoglobus sulfaticallidus PM70-1]|uniref:Glycosyltransferase, TIGR04182 family n=1 Tax=Archaeoglobus sulfaticallidus PM70-1 TaxID=387631 RepID=N0BNY8_9EURY|nr:S-layer glycoprotein N-glycosyltransferase AglJ [Archaeoglobus sulfaticallidus]AGK62045.1 glycosyltransferase, TIGR04182 family [Archaeoglobus sulfaticallidus PM70-1]
MDLDRVCVIIPTLNEEEAIGHTIDEFKKEGFNNIFVIDGNSTDRTREIARKKGAKVEVQSGKGKGQAVAEAFKLVDSDVIILVDGDGTYPAKDAKKLLDPIFKDVADHVVGNRLKNYEKGAFTRLNLFGNKIINFIFRLFYGVELYDILSGYRALRKELYKSVELQKRGFEVETELTVETISKGFRMVEVPIEYRKRGGKTKLNPLKDGWRIVSTIYNLLPRYSPGRHMYPFGLIMLFLGFITGIYVVYEWFHRITHSLLAILTTLLIIAGIQVIIFGFIADVVFKINAEIRRDLILLREEVKKIKRD